MIPARDFILGGAAVFTVTVKATGKHYTYRINKGKKDRKTDERPIYFANLGIKYEEQIYMGLIEEGPDGLTLRATSGSKVSKTAPSWETLQLALFMAEHDGLLEDNDALRFQHEGRCCVCARPLTNPESIDAGIGPECASKGGM